MIESIKNNLGEKIDFSFQEGNESQADWVVLLGHGVTGNKDRPIVVDTAKALNAAGFSTLSFSFSGNGDSEGRFQESTITKEIEDLGAVLDAVSDRKVCYIGHSMGAAVGVLRAAHDQRIQCLVSLAGMVDTKAFAETEFGDLTPDKDVMWEEDDCPLSSAFMTDLCQSIGSVMPSAKEIYIPWLLVHGTEDDVVLPKDSNDLKEALKDRVELVAISGGDHSFNGEARPQATTSVVNWLKKTLE